MRKAGTFNKTTNRGTKVCQDCGKRRQDANMENEMVCRDCFHLAGIENAHYDGMHEDEPASDCELCVLTGDAPAPAPAPLTDEEKAELKRIRAHVVWATNRINAGKAGRAEYAKVTRYATRLAELEARAK